MTCRLHRLLSSVHVRKCDTLITVTAVAARLERQHDTLDALVNTTNVVCGVDSFILCQESIFGGDLSARLLKLHTAHCLTLVGEDIIQLFFLTLALKVQFLLTVAVHCVTSTQGGSLHTVGLVRQDSVLSAVLKSISEVLADIPQESSLLASLVVHDHIAVTPSGTQVRGTYSTQNTFCVATRCALFIQDVINGRADILVLATYGRIQHC